MQNLGAFQLPAGHLEDMVEKSRRIHTFRMALDVKPSVSSG